jgi:hypothetical protein
LSLALALVFVLSTVYPAFAGTTGTISGTITTQSGQKLAGVSVTAISPSSRYAATTDQGGFFSMTGVTPDTYNLTFVGKGYSDLTIGGVTVVADAVANVSQTLATRLQTIGRTAARSSTSAFQPTQTVDQYTASTAQIQTVLGKSNATSESSLLASIPGASFDSSGYPVLRGGRENEEGFQYEGIDYTDAFTSQFVNSLTLNGFNQFQVTPGAGDASVGNSGTGTINITAKRGSRPAFGLVEADLFTGNNSTRQLHSEYGFATPNGRFSNYAAFFADRTTAFKYGPGGTSATPLGLLFSGRNNSTLNDVVENAIYKFGKDNDQALQFFYENTQFNLHLGYGDVSNLTYKDTDPYYLRNAGAVTGLTNAQIQALQPLTVGQSYVGQKLGGRGAQNYNQPNDTFKLQYTNNISSSMFVTAKFYKVNAVTLFDFPYNSTGYFLGDFAALQGGQRTGFAIDSTKQLDSKNLLGFGGKYEYLHPVYSQPSGSGALMALGGFGSSLEIADFLPNNPATCPITSATKLYRTCGYIFSQFGPGANGNATVLPYSDERTSTNRQDFGFYVKDTFSATDRLKIDMGLRLDGVNNRLPACNINTCQPTSTGTFADGSPDPSKDRFDYAKDTVTPRVLQPRLGAAYQIGRNDSVRASYGRSVEFTPLAFMDVSNGMQGVAQFAGVPSRDPLTGKPATFCGTTGNRLCANYADQLFWEMQNTINGTPIQPAKPTTYNNYEISYSHQFPHAVSVKLTPFYRKSYDATALTRQQIVVNGVPQVDQFGSPVLGPSITTNLGKSQISGVEFFMTKEAAYGFSGSLSLTYQNEFSNVVPTSASEDFFPSIPPDSLALGKLYRVGFLSPFVGTLALNYKTRSGWRINPTIFYNHGYPTGVGTLTAANVNGKSVNVPNTNVTNPAQLGGTTGAYAYVDPQNPGTVFNPNIDATRGTPNGVDPGSILSKARLQPVQLAIEYSSPLHPKNTVGVLVTNLFNNYYSDPALNTRYQPVATGSGAPYSGYTSLATVPGAYPGLYNYTSRQGNLPYLLTASRAPRTVQFYYQLGF